MGRHRGQWDRPALIRQTDRHLIKTPDIANEKSRLQR